MHFGIQKCTLRVYVQLFIVIIWNTVTTGKFPTEIIIGKLKTSAISKKRVRFLGIIRFLVEGRSLLACV